MEELEAQDLPSLPVRVMNVFVAPGELMAGLKDRPAWIGAVALGAGLTVLSALLLPAEVFEATMRAAMLERGGDVPEGIENTANLFRYAGAAAGFAFWWVISAAMAGLIMLIFAFILGDQGTYRQYLAVLAHAFVISAVGTVVVVPLRISAQDAQLLLSVGTLLPFLEDGYLARAVGFLDLFGLWAWVVVAIGVAAIEPKRNLGGAIAIVMVIPIAIAMIFGIFGG